MIEKWDKLILYRKTMVLPRVFQVMRWISAVNYVFALLFILAAAYEYGFRVTLVEAGRIDTFFHAVWILFLLNYTLRLVIGEPDGKAKMTFWSALLMVMLYLTLLPVIFHLPEEDSGVQWVWLFFDSKTYRMTTLALLSVTQLSGGLVHLLGKHTNPPIILAVSFLTIIFVGSGLLMLPEVNVGGIHWIDALFTATSATCVTGLNTVDITEAFTHKGQLIILILFQMGGLGVMTFTSFFAMFYMGKTSLYNQLAIGDMISSDSLSSLLSTLLYILGFTLSIEAAGAAVIWLDVHGTMGMTDDEELFFCVFHAVSAFCNAGFSTLSDGMGSQSLMSGHLTSYIAIIFLVIGGSIGFPILVNLLSTAAYYLKIAKWWLLRKKGHFPRRVHLYNLNTKIVLIMSAVLIGGGTLMFAALEWDGTLSGLPTLDRVVHSVFNAVCNRTAGISSLSLTEMKRQTVLMIILMMVIGGGTQSTAGGVKMNVIAVVLMNLWAVIRGADRVAVFRRELSDDSIRRSNAALMLYLALLTLCIFIMTFIEPGAPLLKIVFECVSALSTVGLSLDFTSTLSTAGKALIIMMMFIGRVGAFTLATGLIRQVKKQHFHYPSDNIIIN